MKEYDLYIPMVAENGKRFARAHIRNVESLLVQKFGGVTNFRHKSKGVWKIGNAIFRDEILILRTLAPPTKATRKFFEQLKEDLEKALSQEEILVVERRVTVL